LLFRIKVTFSFLLYMPGTKFPGQFTLKKSYINMKEKTY